MPRPVDEPMLAAGAQLRAAAEAAHAFGLAAAHLGLDEPLVVVSTAEDQRQRSYEVLFNPRLVRMSEQSAAGPEGSVSMPGVEVPVSRAVWVEVEWENQFGQAERQRFDGFVARVLQHEIDQMNGVFFLQRVSKLKRDMALRKFEKSAKGSM